MSLPVPANVLATPDTRSPFHSLRSGYSFAIYLLKDILGIDPVVLVNASLAFAAVATFSRWISGSFYATLREWCLSSIHVNDDDPLYQVVMVWMAAHHILAESSRSAKAVTVQNSSLQDDEDAMDAIDAVEAPSLRDGQLISYRTMIGRSPIQLQFDGMTHLFRHKGRFFYFRHHRTKGENGRREDPYGTTLKDICSVSFECLGRSAGPIKALLTDAQSYALSQPKTTVRVTRALGGYWNSFIDRPSRSIDTVILDERKKQMLLRDINEYLHPRTRRWYLTHGIPYRRGYLFSGEPGTGKTSLTAALANVFGLDLYVLSLLDPAINESVLAQLFSTLSTRCILLLEDIDSAGLNRPAEKRSGQPFGAATGNHFPRAEISLSGLLNAIDGVSSHEGRILIMTTNEPELLDKALVRPGRVDMHIVFELPAKIEMVELFMSMYKELITEDEKPTHTSMPGPPSANVKDVPPSMDATSQDASHSQREKQPAATDRAIEKLAKSQMQHLAETFAAALPERKFSLAAIQGYLLTHKRDPRTAASSAPAWTAETLKTMEEDEAARKAREDRDRLELMRQEKEKEEVVVVPNGPSEKAPPKESPEKLTNGSGEENTNDEVDKE